MTGAKYYVLLIKDGEFVAAGPKKEVIVEDLLSETFRVPVKVLWENKRPFLSILQES